jgi:hypothetical protein
MKKVDVVILIETNDLRALIDELNINHRREVIGHPKLTQKLSVQT